ILATQPVGWSMKLLTNSLSIRNFVAGHPYRFFLISTVSSREVFNSSKNLFYTSPLSRFIAVISAPPSSPAPAPRSAGNGCHNRPLQPARIRYCSLPASPPASSGTLCDPPNCRGCVNHPPPTACCSPAGSPDRNGIHQSTPVRTDAHALRTFCRTPG